MKKQLLIAGLFGCAIFFIFYFYINKSKETRSGVAMAPVLVVGTNAQFPPYEFLENGQIVGFDIDLINEVAARMGRTVELKDVDFDMLLLEAQVGNIQVIAAAMTPTPERADKVFFTQSYAGDDPLVIITRSENVVAGIDDLVGKEVVVNEGFTADRYISEQPGIQVKRLSTVSDAFLSLSLHRAFAFVSAQSAVEPFFKQYDRAGFNVVVLPVLETYAFAVSKKHSDLLNLIDKALEEIKQDGTLKSIKVKWHIV